MKTTIYIIAILVLNGSSFAQAAGKCSANKLASTQKKVSALMKADSPKASDVWGTLRKSFDGNRDCMAVYETYDFGEAVRHLMKSHWDQIGELEKYKTQDSSFFRFVISALKDETANIEDIKRLYSLAEANCPKGAENILRAVGQNTTTSK